MKQIFADFEILKLARDPEAPGIFLKARKPSSWSPCDLEDIELYSMVLGRRTREIVDWSKAPFLRRLKIRAANIFVSAALLAWRGVGGKLYM